MYIKHNLKPWALERKKKKRAENLDFHPQSCVDSTFSCYWFVYKSINKNYVALVLSFKENSISIARSLGLPYKVVLTFKAQTCLVD